MSAARIRASLRRSADWIAALGLAAAGQFELWVGTDQAFPGSKAAHALFLLATSLPLAWRRCRPLAVLAVISAGTPAYAYAMYDLGQQPPFEPYLALLVALYTAAAQLDGRRLALAAGIAVAGIAAIAAALVAGNTAGDSAGALLFVGVCWGMGRLVRRQRLLAAALGDRATRLAREREQRERAAVAEERARIARELHDVIAHSVSVMVLEASVERRMLGAEQASTREALHSIERTGREALAELRRLLGVLRRSGDERPALAPQPSLRHLDVLLAQVRDAGLPVTVRHDGEPRALPAGVDLSAYRIVQEALTNVLKHAEATRAEVVVGYADDTLALEVSDDGCGAVNGAGATGHGLVGMGERVALYGGVLEAGPREGGGYRVAARIPLEAR